MRMLNISSMDDLIANSMDILEPAPVDQHGNAREDGMCGTQYLLTVQKINPDFPVLQIVCVFFPSLIECMRKEII